MHSLASPSEKHESAFKQLGPFDKGQNQKKRTGLAFMDKAPAHTQERSQPDSKTHCDAIPETLLSWWPPSLKDSHRTAPHTRGWLPRGPFGPCSFPFPVLVSQHLGALGGFLRLLAAPPAVGLHHTGLQGLDLPSFRTKEPRVSNRDVNSLMNGGSYLSEAMSWNNTPPCVENINRQAR